MEKFSLERRHRTVQIKTLNNWNYMRSGFVCTLLCTLLAFLYGDIWALNSDFYLFAKFSRHIRIKCVKEKSWIFSCITTKTLALNRCENRFYVYINQRKVTGMCEYGAFCLLMDMFTLSKYETQTISQSKLENRLTLLCIL